MSAAILPPSRLYKYFTFSAQSLENLKNQIIYFGSPREFNDPYDCSVTPAVRLPTDAEIARIRLKYLNDESIDSVTRAQLRGLSIENFCRMICQLAEKTAAEKVKEFNEKRGVSCFSEVREDLLMWAHYGGNYRGFCLEFDTQHFEKFQQVKYSIEMPTFDPIQLLEPNSEADDFMAVFSSKSPSWAYEKEWRLLHAEKNTSYCYRPEALTGVYFGPEMSDAALEIICLILQGQNETVAFWKGTRSVEQFKVNFEKFDYLSYLQAKKSDTHN